MMLHSVILTFFNIYKYSNINKIGNANNFKISQRQNIFSLNKTFVMPGVDASKY